jgi:N-acetylglutamate synthase-like GNAT family acetyltransferase
LKIQKITHNEVKPLISKSKGDKVCLKDTKTTQWFGVYQEEALCGCAGVIIKNGKGRIRGVFILPDCRKFGMGSKLMRYIVEYMEDSGVSYIDQLSSHPNWWLKNGWTTKSIVTNGSWIYKKI